MNCILFDDNRLDLLPLTYTRPVADIRVGILTVREKWEFMLDTQISSITESYLQKKYPLVSKDANLLINGSILPNHDLIKAVKDLGPGNALTQNSKLIACVLDKQELSNFIEGNTEGMAQKIWDNEFIQLNNCTDIFQMNGPAIEQDFELLTHNKTSATISPTNQVLGENIFIEEGAKIECACINTHSGPVYIGKDTEIMEGCLIRGPFALCDNATLKMGTKIYGPTTIGPYSKAGGEINNSVILGYSNKGHDGFLGNSVIGEWCNLGADTNNSNLKNNYTEVKLWNYESERFQPTGLKFCGLIMGDHSKCGINTMFNTGTVVGVSANIFGSGFPRNFIPSFSWGNTKTNFALDKALEVATNVLERRDKELTAEDTEILSHIYNETQVFRG